MSKNFYITTPIYYPSAKPHMGHAYTSIIADFFARFKKIQGCNVFFLTGTDEQGLKIQRAAEKKGMNPKDFCDQIRKTFKNLSKTSILYYFFFRWSFFSFGFSFGFCCFNFTSFNSFSTFTK